MKPLEARSRLLELIRCPVRQAPLDEAALLLAADEYPDLDIASYLRRLDQLADAVRELRPGGDPVDRIASLRRTIFEQGGFHGNRDAYYDPRNSYLNEVLDRRLGIPITLSLLLIGVARRLGWPIYGVNFPGHYLCCYETGDVSIAVDCFDGGLILGEDEVAARWLLLSGGDPPPIREMLAPASATATLVRILNNLKLIYAQARDWPRALVVAHKMLLLHPDHAIHVRDVGMISLAVGRYTEAQSALTHYLHVAPAAPDREVIEGCLRLAEERIPPWHRSASP